MWGGQKLTFYNSPLMVAISIALFGIFLKIKVQNKLINNISKSMFAVYLLQDGLAGQSAYEYVYDAYCRSEFWIVVMYVVVLFLMAYILEKVRNPITQPLVEIIAKYLQKQNDSKEKNRIS